MQHYIIDASSLTKIDIYKNFINMVKDQLLTTNKITLILSKKISFKNFIRKYFDNIFYIEDDIFYESIINNFLDFTNEIFIFNGNILKYNNDLIIKKHFLDINSFHINFPIPQENILRIGYILQDKKFKKLNFNNFKNVKFINVRSNIENKQIDILLHKHYNYWKSRS